MAREKKDNIKVTYYINREVADKLEEYSESTGVPKSIIVERCLKQFIDDHSSETDSKTKK